MKDPYDIYADRFSEEDTPDGYFIKPNYECSLKEEIIEAMKEYAAQEGWISVQTPPELHTLVLGYDKTLNRPTVVEYGEDNYWFDQYDNSILISHWMPLPPLPSPPTSNTKK